MLSTKIRDDLNVARRERDKLRTTVLTTMLSEIRNREIEVQHELTDDEVVEVVNRQIKRRREAAEQMRGGGREELAQKEEQEAELLKAYLPQQLSEDEARAIVREAVAGGAKDVGSVMKAVMPKLKGKFDGKETNRLVREELG
ncbi:MAG TPA: GatB/YqeY domain-containing protein [Longimicrobiales bacterium]